MSHAISLTMSHYHYSPLSLEVDSIRLLRLMPHKDETAPIQCELFEYSLQEPSNKTHLYEALSYIWGRPETSKSIFIDEHNLPITANLYSALSRLRNRFFERIIWADFVCINQTDEKEKERQIRLMAKIYGQANRVIVYLGEAAENSDHALEDIRISAENDSTTPSEYNQEAIVKLLERPWFRRIWVLQEVAAARCILIICGFAEMNGYTFCAGLNRLEFSLHTDLQSLIRSTSYLVRGAIFRSANTQNLSTGLSLGELVDMYHTHESTLLHDKVYALLGMSSDNPSAVGLLPDYTVPWKVLLQRLIEFILSGVLSIETWDKKEMAVIKSRGHVLGYLSSREDNTTRLDRQYVNVIFNNTPKALEYEKAYGTRWALQTSAKPIREQDLVCFLQGASKPIIIRAYKDHFAIIMIAVIPRRYIRTTKTEYVKRQKPLASPKPFLHDFLLVWNWGNSEGNLQNQTSYEASRDIDDLIPDYLNRSSNKAIRSYNVSLAVEDSKMDEKAIKRLQKATEDLKRKIGTEHLHTLMSIESLARAYQNQQQWAEAEDLSLQVIETRMQTQGKTHRDTLGSIAKLTSIYADQDCWDSQKYITSLTGGIKDNAKITEKDMIQAAALSCKGPIMLSMVLKDENLPISEAVVVVAAGNKVRGAEMIALLLNRYSKEVKITEEVVKAAAANQGSGYWVMKLLLDWHSNEVKVTEEVVKAAAANQGLGYRVMKLLLDQRGDEVKVTEEVVKAAAANPGNSYMVMILLLDQRGDEIKVTEEVVKAVAANPGNGYWVMELLLNWRGDEFTITEEMLKAAASNESVVGVLTKHIVKNDK